MLRTIERNRRWRRQSGPRATAVAAVVATAVLALSACGGSGSSGGSGGANKDGLGRITTFAAKDRKPFPVLSGSTLDGSTLDLASLKGKVVVVNIWGSWCGPCREEAQYLERVYEENKDKGVAFVGIDTRDNTPQSKAFFAEKQMTYPRLVDCDDETLLTKLVGIVPLQAVPTTVIVDRNGKVAWRVTDQVDAKTLSAGLDPIVAEK